MIYPESVNLLNEPLKEAEEVNEESDEDKEGKSSQSKKQPDEGTRDEITNTSVAPAKKTTENGCWSTAALQLLLLSY